MLAAAWTDCILWFPCNCNCQPNIVNESEEFLPKLQTFYALRVLKSAGLCGFALWDVANAVLISRIMYASSEWWGFTDVSDGQCLQSIINKAVKQGFLPLPRHL